MQAKAFPRLHWNDQARVEHAVAVLKQKLGALEKELSEKIAQQAFKKRNLYFLFCCHLKYVEDEILLLNL